MRCSLVIPIYTAKQVHLQKERCGNVLLSSIEKQLLYRGRRARANQRRACQHGGLLSRFPPRRRVTGSSLQQGLVTLSRHPLFILALVSHCHRAGSSGCCGNRERSSCGPVDVTSSHFYQGFRIDVRSRAGKGVSTIGRSPCINYG